MTNSGKKKYQFLLLDAGPIIKLFELSIWEEFIKRCDVTIARTVAEQPVFYGPDDAKEYIDFGLKSYEEKGLIRIIEVQTSVIIELIKPLRGHYDIHAGEDETLAFLLGSAEPWKVCAADGAVFSVLGFLGKAGQGISLEEVLSEIGLGRALGWKFSKKFREKYTKLGEIDAIQC
jgi:hypothetical protein